MKAVRWPFTSPTLQMQIRKSPFTLLVRLWHEVTAPREIPIRQIAALPYRSEPDGSVRLLMITSRETRRWVIPKGNAMRGLPPHLAAAQEAFEEAGVSGEAWPAPLGSYTYFKRLRDGRFRKATVRVFPLAVQEQAERWPEAGQRERRWFDLAEAAEAVEEEELKGLIASFKIVTADRGLKQPDSAAGPGSG